MTINVYADRDIVVLDDCGGFYMRHVGRMTAEGLRSKGAIAAELGYRDAQIDYLEKKIRSALTATHPDAYPVLLQEALDRAHFLRL